MLDVTAAILIKDGKVIIAKRKPDDKLPHKWELPGGKVESGESAQECLKREMQEELRQFRQAEQESAASAGGDLSVDAGGSVQQRVDKASSAFDRVQERVTGLVGRSASSIEDAAKLVISAGLVYPNDKSEAPTPIGEVRQPPARAAPPRRALQRYQLGL